MSRTSERSFPQLVGDDSVVVAQDRFGARRRAQRRKVLGVWAVVVLLLLAAGWILLASPWGTVRSVTVTGTARTDAGQVRALAAPELGRPLVLVRTGDLAERVGTLPLVASARVERVWPGGLRVVVTERQPVAALPKDGRFSLVDRDGVEVALVAAAPASLPVVQVDLVTAGAAAVRSALDSLALLPAPLRREIRQVGAASGDGVWFRLADGDQVVWGDASQLDLKVAALDALRRQTGRERAAQRKKGFVALSRKPVTFDVSAPGAPSVQR